MLVGAAGSGKTTFARRHFRAAEIVSLDACRARMLRDSRGPDDVSHAASELLRRTVASRLAAGQLVVVDAANLAGHARKSLVQLARAHDCAAVVLVLDMAEALCVERCLARERSADPAPVRAQVEQLDAALPGLRDEGFRAVHVLREHQVDRVFVKRHRLWSNRRHDSGPFDIIGDVHGCADELARLLDQLGYLRAHGDGAHRHPEGRKAIFLGDLVDRGPDVPGVLRTVMRMVDAGTALCVSGNHEAKLLRALSGKNVRLTHGLAESVEQLAREDASFRESVARFIDRLGFHYVLDHGRLVVAHAGLREALQGRVSGRVREFALYGETTGEVDEVGLPVRLDWARAYGGEAAVVYGHTPMEEAHWVNNTLCVDTGCVFGGKLTALRYPERQLVSVAAARVYCPPVKPLGRHVAPHLPLAAAESDTPSS